MLKNRSNLDVSPIIQPILINKLEIKNRIAMSPMNCNYTDPEHYVSRQQMAYYAARAKGGTGLIITEAQAVSEHPIADTYRKYNNPYLTSYKYIPKQSNFVEHVHSFGAKIFAQLFTGPGRQGSNDLGAADIVSASPIPWKQNWGKLINGSGEQFIAAAARLAGYHGKIPPIDDIKALKDFFEKIPYLHATGAMPREITKEEIKALVKDMGKGAKIAKMCGYDGIEVHACHGYLVHTFIAERSNKRKDEYGGSFENRIRFMLELIRSARKAVGPDYPVGVRFSASEDLPDGYTPEFAAKIAKRCEEEGADYINLSDGSYEAMSDFLPNTEGQVIDKAAVIKKAVNIPVICPSVHNPENVVDVLKNGKADMVQQGRQQICDPEWVNKVIDRRFDDIIKCTRCNRGCIFRFIAMLPVRCVRNPIVGQEEFIEEYMRRPVLPLKSKAWHEIHELTEMNPSETWEYTDEEIREAVEM